MYISVLMILCARWSAWMRRTGSSLRSGVFRQSPEIQSERIMNTAAAVWPICLLRLNRWLAREW